MSILCIVLTKRCPHVIIGIKSHVKNRLRDGTVFYFFGGQKSIIVWMSNKRQGFDIKLICIFLHVFLFCFCFVWQCQFHVVLTTKCPLLIIGIKKQVKKIITWLSCNRYVMCFDTIIRCQFDVVLRLQWFTCIAGMFVI